MTGTWDMKRSLFFLATLALVALTASTQAMVHYVDANSSAPAAPYTNWFTAAQIIQDAVDAAAAGDEVLVTNGIYATGQRLVGTNLLASRVSVTNSITLRSVSGPEFTIIRGAWDPVATNGPAAIRCVSLANGASLLGFTLTGGATRTNWSDDGGGGGVWCESTNALVTSCVIVGNSAFDGGGAWGGTLRNCTLSNNHSTAQGGGAWGSTLYDCTLRGNRTEGYGGGACRGALYRCTLTGGSAALGGGASLTTLCNCALVSNSAGLNGGGAYGSTLQNCTLTGNSTDGFGGGASGCALYNCVVCFNTLMDGSEANYDSECTLNYCCTMPLPPTGCGNIALDPQLASLSHLGAGSPCRGAGSAAYSIGTDIDGEPWANPPSVGCDEYVPGAASGPLTVSLSANYTNFATGYPARFTALIAGQTTQSVWDFGDGVGATNRPVTSHAWAQPGHYPVSLWAFNESHTQGVSATLTVLVGYDVRYVAAANPHPVPPYASWAAAATSIQAAVDAAGIGARVLVTNGVYTGGVTLATPVTLLSINGPQFTIIDGGGATNCVSLAAAAALSGFTLTNGSSGLVGGGVFCVPSAVVSNCLLTHNSANSDGGGAYGGTLYNCTLRNNLATFGGGVRGSTLYNCTLVGNSAAYDAGAYCSTLYNCALTGNAAYYEGGGAGRSKLYNCTLVGNSARELSGGGAADWSTLYNCIVYSNTAPLQANYDLSVTLDYCCTTPIPTNGLGNIALDPLFADPANGDLRLRPASPCINSGRNANAPTQLDLDGNPRIVSGTVDIGAYEYQGMGSVMSYAWLMQYGFPTDGSADYADPDRDGMNNWQERHCLTDPTNALSFLRLLTPSVTATNVALRWQGAEGVVYSLECCTNQATPLIFSPDVWNQDIRGQDGLMTLTVPRPAGGCPVLYRLKVGE